MQIELKSERDFVTECKSGSKLCMGVEKQVNAENGEKW